jgi:hypothetical protein
MLIYPASSTSLRTANARASLFRLRMCTAVTSGNPQTVNLSISGVPSGASATFNPASAPGTTR